MTHASLTAADRAQASLDAWWAQAHGWDPVDPDDPMLEGGDARARLELALNRPA
jgi:hypothetical protein